MNTDATRKIRLIMHLRNMGITDTKTLAAMEKVPREMFVPAAMHDQAYEDIAKRNRTHLDSVEALAGEKAIQNTKSGYFVEGPGGWTRK